MILTTSLQEFTEKYRYSVVCEQALSEDESEDMSENANDTAENDLTF